MKALFIGFIALSFIGCSSISVRYKDAEVTSTRLFVNQDLSGLKITTPEGIKVSLDKRTENTENTDTAALNDAIANVIEAYTLRGR